MGDGVLRKDGGKVGWSGVEWGKTAEGEGSSCAFSFNEGSDSDLFPRGPPDIASRLRC